SPRRSPPTSPAPSSPSMAGSGGINIRDSYPLSQGERDPERRKQHDRGPHHGVRLERQAVSEVRGREDAAAARPVGPGAAGGGETRGRSRLWAGQLDRAPGRALPHGGRDRPRLLAQHAGAGEEAP